jgi:hypothetical protein
MGDFGLFTADSGAHARSIPAEMHLGERRQRELAQMLDNNGTERAVLKDLAKDLPAARE